MNSQNESDHAATTYGSLYSFRFNRLPNQMCLEVSVRLVCALLFACCCASTADSPFVGKWKIDVSKSRPDPSGPGITAHVIAYTAEDEVLVGKAWGADGSARPNVMRYDGHERAAAAKSVNPVGYTTLVATAHGATLEVLFKKDGKVVGSRRNSLSPDGRTMTETLGGTTVDGRKLHSTLVYHKEQMRGPNAGDQEATSHSFGPTLNADHNNALRAFLRGL